MDLSPYLETLRRDLAAAAAPGGPDVTRAADLLANSLDASARLCLLEVLSDATAEITSQLNTVSVEVRLRGREADLVINESAPAATATAPAAPPAPADNGDLTRVTLRLPDSTKEQVERAASAEGVSVNAWLVRAIAAALHGPSAPLGPPLPAFPPPPSRGRRGHRITGFAQS